MIDINILKQFYAEYTLDQILQYEESLGITASNFSSKYIYDKNQS